MRQLRMNWIGRWVNRFPGLIAFGVLATVTQVWAVAPNLTVVSPSGGQRGKEVKVTLRGERLEDAQDLMFYREGMALERFETKEEKRVVAVLRLDAACPLGEHPFRLRTASGISALRIFYVGPFPTVAEQEPNNERATAQVLAMNVTVEGAGATDDVDWFAVDAEQGQRLSFEIEGARLGRTMFDPVLTVFDATGRKLARTDDVPLLGHDGFVSVIAPAAGRYYVELHDAAYAGTGHVYRLHAGDFPRPAVMTPQGGLAGSVQQARFLGDPKGEFTREIRVPTSGGERVGVELVDRVASPSPNWFRASDMPNAPAVKTEATPAKAPKVAVAVPFAFDGVLATPGEAACFKFSAKKDDNLDFQVYARRLGSPIDSVLAVLDAKGKTLGSNDDAAGNPDSAVRVKIPEDGDYVVRVADQLGRGGPTYAYRVEIRPVTPAVVLSIPDTARYDYETRKSLVVPRGNRFAILLNTTRDSCNADLKVLFPGLPPGISYQADEVPGSLSAVPVVFEAAVDAPAGGVLLAPTVSVAADDKTKSTGATVRYRHTVEWVRIQNDTVYVKSEVDRIAAAVAEPVPFRITVVEPRVPVVQNGEMELKVLVDRDPGYDEPVTVRMLWNPPGVTTLPDMVVAKGVASTTYKLNASAKAEVRKWKTAVVAGATVRGGTAYVSSALTTVEIASPHVAGRIDLTKLERGGKGRLVCGLEQKEPFEGKAIATLVGLPAGVTTEPVEITRDSKEAVFELSATDKSPVGTHRGLFCRVVVTRNEEPITHLIAQGGILRIDPPRGGQVAAAK
jgi:hypothetical protein